MAQAYPNIQKLCNTFIIFKKITTPEQNPKINGGYVKLFLALYNENIANYKKINPNPLSIGNQSTKDIP